RGRRRAQPLLRRQPLDGGRRRGRAVGHGRRHDRSPGGRRDVGGRRRRGHRRRRRGADRRRRRRGLRRRRRGGLRARRHRDLGPRRDPDLRRGRRHDLRRHAGFERSRRGRRRPPDRRPAAARDLRRRGDDAARIPVPARRARPGRRNRRGGPHPAADRAGPLHRARREGREADLRRRPPAPDLRARERRAPGGHPLPGPGPAAAVARPADRAPGGRAELLREPARDHRRLPDPPEPAPGPQHLRQPEGGLTPSSHSAAAPPQSLLDRRRLAIAHSATQRGLASVEASSAASGYLLSLHFVPTAESAEPKAAVPPGLRIGNFSLAVAGGGDPGLAIAGIEPAPPGGSRLDLKVEETGARAGAPRAGNAVVYTLELVGVPNLDRFFSAASFTLDGGPPPPVPEPPAASALAKPAVAAIDYLARDYESFRRLLLERMTLTIPSWSERNPADYGIALVEILAYVADDLAYYQDAVATEAYLSTARLRQSVVRHARLLDYQVSPGHNARTWAQVQVSAPLLLPLGTRIYAEIPGVEPAFDPSEVEDETPEDLANAMTFETMADAWLEPGYEAMPIYAWGALDYALPRGATAAALAGS